MRAFLVLALAVALTALGMAAGCTDLGVGRKCLNPGSTVAGVSISSPALECRTRLCLLNVTADPMNPRTVCTARCNTNDDCAAGLMGEPLNGQCPGRFVCAVASKTGVFACQTVCMCEKDVDPQANGDTDAGVGCPQSCSAGCKTANQVE